MYKISFDTACNCLVKFVQLEARVRRATFSQTEKWVFSASALAAAHARPLKQQSCEANCTRQGPEH